MNKYQTIRQVITAIFVMTLFRPLIALIFHRPFGATQVTRLYVNVKTRDRAMKLVTPGNDPISFEQAAR